MPPYESENLKSSHEGGFACRRKTLLFGRIFYCGVDLAHGSIEWRLPSRSNEGGLNDSHRIRSKENSNFRSYRARAVHHCSDRLCTIWRLSEPGVAEFGTGDKKGRGGN